MGLCFHHFFVFVSPGATVVDYLVSLGFKEGTPNTHPGQGTRNRRLFFDNGMLEFIWVHDETEVRSTLTAPTRLWERSQRIYSPFGVCVCPENGHLTFEGEAYRPSYLPPGLKILGAQNDEFPWEPMIFCLPFVGPISESVEHPNGVRRIGKISVECAGASFS